MDASNMTPAQKRGVLACWEVLNKSHDCAVDAAVFAASMTGHTFKPDDEDLREQDVILLDDLEGKEREKAFAQNRAEDARIVGRAMAKILTGIAGYENMSDTDSEDQGVTFMIEHLRGKGHRRLGNARSLRVKYQRAKEAKLVAAGAGLAGVAVASEENDSEDRDGDGDGDS